MQLTYQQYLRQARRSYSSLVQIKIFALHKDKPGLANSSNPPPYTTDSNEVTPLSGGFPV